MRWRPLLWVVATLAGGRLVTACVAAATGPRVADRRLVSAKCSACHLAPSERSIAPTDLASALERHHKRVQLTEDEVQIITGHLADEGRAPSSADLH